MKRVLAPLLAWLRRALVRHEGHGTLVVQPLPGIGDMVWHLPHLHTIADHQGPVDVLTKRRSLAASLLSADPGVREFLWLERPGAHDGLLGVIRLARLLRERGYARAWLLHQSSRYALALALAGIPETTGYGDGVMRGLLSRCVGLDARLKHPIAKADALFAGLGLALPAEGRLAVDESALAYVRKSILGPDEDWVALGIGSSEAYKQWGASAFAELAHRLVAKYRTGIVVVGGPEETGLWEELRGRCAGLALRDAVGLPLEQAVAVLASARLYVGNDTGVLNISGAVGVNGIGLFGGSEPLTHSRFIHALSPATPGAGMAGISVDAVLSFIEQHELLDASPPVGKEL